MILALLLACAHPLPEARLPEGAPLHGLRVGASAPLPPALRVARRGPPPPTPEVDLLEALGPRLEGLVLDESLGGELTARLEEEDPDDVETWGAGTLTLTELYGIEDFSGEEGLCEAPHASYSFEEDGLSWEARVELSGLITLLEPPATLYMDLSSTCAEAVDAAVGDVDAAVASGACTEGEQQAFFADDSACLACVQDGATVAGCQGEGACLEETVQVFRYLGRWYDLAGASVLACAPDQILRVFFASTDLPEDGTLPGSWNQTSWPWICFAVRAEGSGEVELICAADGDGYDDLTDGYGDGVIGRLDYLREEGEEGEPHAERVFYARSLSFTNGMETEHLLLSFGGIGQISAPTYMTDWDEDGDIDDDDWGGGYGGWGMSPLELRPDGTDPAEVDDTYARDWLGAVVTKMATTRDGVPINNMNDSRCEDWAGPHEDGSWTCTKNGRPELGWFVDNHTFWYNRSQTMVQVIPMMTLGSTGLPDDWMPGGFLPHIAGTAELANPDWDDCA